jgi:predicted GIY-YIG superfamily endonuclease
MYYVYFLRGPKNHLYVGYAHNIEQRIKRHRAGNGAEFTKKYQAFELVYSEEFLTSLEARRREKQIKSWTREKKDNLIKFGKPIM